MRSRPRYSVVSVPVMAATRTYRRSASPCTVPRSWFKVSCDVSAAVKLAITITDADHPHDGEQPARQRHGHLLTRCTAALGHRHRRPPNTCAQASPMGAKMLVVPVLDKPENDANRKRDDEKHCHGAQKTEGKHVGYDRPPGNTPIRCHCNARPVL